MPEPVLLQHAPADVVRQALIDLGAGVAVGSYGSWPIVASHEPDTPDNVIVVYDTVGVLDGRLMASGEFQEHYGIQIMVRAVAGSATGAYTIGRNKTDAIIALLDQQTYRQTVTVALNQVTNVQYRIQAMNRRGGVNSLGRSMDNSSRELFTVNYLASICQLT